MSEHNRAEGFRTERPGAEDAEEITATATSSASSSPDSARTARPAAHSASAARREQPRSGPSRKRGGFRRALKLLALTAFLPGQAQIRTGAKGFGRVAFLITLACWAAALIALVLFLLDRTLLLSLLLSPGFSSVLAVVLVVLAVGWGLLYLSALRAGTPFSLSRGRALSTVVITVLLAALSLSPLLLASSALRQVNSALDSVFTGQTDLKASQGRYNILMLGGDSGTDRTGRRPDSISVLSIDAATGQAVTLAIPRNLQNAPFPDSSPLKEVFPQGYNCGDECIINALYGMVNSEYKDLYPGSEDPGAQAMMETASEILGIQVSSYILVDMGGFSDLVDAMGGVKVTSGGWVPVTAGEIPGTDPVRHYPPSEWMAPGTLTLDGYHAEWFARSREYTSDYNRIQRQQCIQSAISQQMTLPTILTRGSAISQAAAKLMESNISRSSAGTLTDALGKMRGHQMQRLTIGAPDFDEMFSTYPDFEQVHTRVAQVLASSGSQALSGPADPMPLAVRAASLHPVLRPLPAALPAADTAPDGTKITPDYLNQLAQNWDDATLTAILNDNGECSPAS